MTAPEGNEPYFLDEPRRHEEEMLASGRRAQAELRQLMQMGKERAEYWDKILFLNINRLTNGDEHGIERT